MHPLIPDDYTFRSIRDDGVLQERTLEEIGALDVRARLDEMPMSDVFYVRTHAPGAIELHNFPRFLQHFKRPAGDEIDLAAIDVIRTRERGVPRYNQFRRLFHLKPVESFREMTDNPEWAEELEEVYGDVERVDHMVGMYAEPKPRLRVQRHGVPRLHPDGVAPAEERPVLHARLPAGGLHQGRDRLGGGQHDAHAAAPHFPSWSLRSRASRTPSRPGGKSAPSGR